MSSRKPGYLIGVILLALVMSAPQLVLCFEFGMRAYQSGRLPQYSIPGFGETLAYGHLLTYATFWQDRFVYPGNGRLTTTGFFEWTVTATDPETGTESDLGWELSGRNGFSPMAFGERLWLVGNGESYEVVDGAAQPFTFVAPRSWPQEGQRFLLNGEAAYVEQAAAGFTVSTFKSGGWNISSEVVLPDVRRGWMFGQTQVIALWMTCLNQGDRIHFFLQAEGRLLHREGLELKPVSVTNSSRAIQPRVEGDSADEPVSALKAVNTEGEIAGWSLVRETAGDLNSWTHQLGMLVGGQPAALMVDYVQTGHPVGHLYRFDGAKWSEFAKQPFPFGSNQFRAVSCRDGQKSYIVVTTSTGVAHVYAVETSGVRATQGADPLPYRATELLFGYLRVPVGTLFLGVLLGLGTWCLMWWYTKNDYGFGTQTVKLASLGRRGLARLIDLTLIVLSTAALGWMMTRGFDWLSLVEALNLQVDHPTKHIAARVASILALWLAVVVLSLLVVQAYWGLTPGKWCCGLRTLRTTLKPCGFARSLVREVVLSVDACHFLCWTPGILSIACTDCRQRLGDLVADTIVVESRSLASRMKTDVL